MSLKLRWTLLLIGVWILPVLALAQSSSPAPDPVLLQAGPKALAAATPAATLITFSEYPVGTGITTQYQNVGVIFSGSPGTPFISFDSANPTAPVLSGSPQFQGSITATFVYPSKGGGKPKPAEAAAVSFDAGYFDSLNSTTITYFDLKGNAIGFVQNTAYGIQHFTAPGDIHGFTMGITTNEPAGFAIDNLAFQIVQKGARFTVQYSSYIPVDHVSGPTSCPFVIDPFTGTPYIPLIYKGDANRGTYRTAEQITVVPYSQQSYGFYPSTGQTRNYDAIHSPVNGSTLSQADEDGIQYDCNLWNDAGQASSSGFTQDESYQSNPGSDQAQVHFTGAAGNPLELISPPITWDMRTVIDVKNSQKSATAYVNYNHTCYPSHQIKVNDQLVYSYTPGRNDILYIALCLTQINPKIVGQQSVPTAVPVK